MRLLGIVELVKKPQKRIQGVKASFSALWYEVRGECIFVRGENRCVDRVARR